MCANVSTSISVCAHLSSVPDTSDQPQESLSLVGQVIGLLGSLIFAEYAVTARFITWFAPHSVSISKRSHASSVRSSRPLFPTALLSQ